MRQGADQLLDQRTIALVPSHLEVNAARREVFHMSSTLVSSSSERLAEGVRNGQLPPAVYQEGDKASGVRERRRWGAQEARSQGECLNAEIVQYADQSGSPLAYVCPCAHMYSCRMQCVIF